MDFTAPFSIGFLLPILLLPISTTFGSHHKLPLGSSLTANEDNSPWESPSGEFAFGFQKIGNGGFLLAIWFNKIPERTIVWSANRNLLVQTGSKAQLTQDGLLILADATGKPIWSTSSAGRGVAYAALLNTGDFVLANEKSINQWESFHQPTDTLLPTQTFKQGSKLIARYSQMNYSTGRFLLTLKDDGNLEFCTTAFPTDAPISTYWSTDTVGSGDQVIFNQSGSIYLIEKNGSMINLVPPGGASTEEVYQRAVLDYDGVFRHYVYPKHSGSTSGVWPVTWSILAFTPPNICTSIVANTGSGACGFNSYCGLGYDQRPNCLCPRGYTFIDPNDLMKGCIQNFIPQSCDNSSQETDLFYLDEMQNTDWPWSDYEHFRQVNEGWCRQACLSDCFCAVAIFRNEECWKKKVPLSNGRMDRSVGGKALIKVRKDNSTVEPADTDSRKKDHFIIIGSVLLSSSIFLNFLFIAGTILIVFHFNSMHKRMLQPSPVVPGMNVRCFTYSELEKATNGFMEELGKGAFATVYKGALELDNTGFVAIKKLHNMVSQSEQEFKTEVAAIGRTNHRNLVKLLGFCNEEHHYLLIYELMRNGSLADLIFRGSRPSWHLRMQIACGIARGLVYLHEECNTQIIHCDIKPQNILLDNTFTAKISDFGLAKLLKADQTRTNTEIRGTRGYVAPEWFKNLPITSKVDVYSFGILFLELICCRKNFKIEVEDENQMILADWAYDCYKEEKIYLLVGDDEEAVKDIDKLKKCVMIAIWCIQEDPYVRPNMKKVKQMLEGATEVAVPPDPESFISSNRSL